MLVAPRAIGSGLLLLERALLPCCLFRGFIAGSRSTSVQRGEVDLFDAWQACLVSRTNKADCATTKDRPAAVGGAVHDLTIAGASTQAIASTAALTTQLNWHCSAGGTFGAVELLLESCCAAAAVLPDRSQPPIKAHCSIIEPSDVALRIL